METKESQRKLKLSMEWANCGHNDFTRVYNLYPQASRTSSSETVADNLLSYSQGTKLIGGLAAATALYFIGESASEALNDLPLVADRLIGAAAAVAGYLTLRKPLFRAGLDTGLRVISRQVQ